jgi:hypothetical protein
VAVVEGFGFGFTFAIGAISMHVFEFMGLLFDYDDIFILLIMNK